MVNYKKVLFDSLIEENCFIFKKGPYITSGGLAVPFYIDLRRLAGNPATLQVLAKWFADNAVGCSHIGGVATGGIPFSFAASILSGKPAFYVRKKSQSHGLKSIIAGMDPDKIKTICLVDDSVGGGDTIWNAINGLKKEGKAISSFIYLMEGDIRGSGHNRSVELTQQNIVCKYIATWREWINYMLKNRRISKVLAQYCFEFIDDPLSFDEDKLDKYKRDEIDGKLWIGNNNTD